MKRITRAQFVVQTIGKKRRELGRHGLAVTEGVGNGSITSVRVLSACPLRAQNNYFLMLGHLADQIQF